MPLYFRSTFIKAAWVGALFVLPAFASAGEITRPDAGQDFQWKSTTCRLPIAPSPSSGGSKQDRLMQYALEIETYIECIQKEAQQDFQIAQQELQEAIERDLEAQTKIMNDMMLRAAKTLR